MRTALVAAIAAVFLAACGGNVDSLDAQSLTGVSQKALAQRKDLAAADSTPVFDGKRGDFLKMAHRHIPGQCEYLQVQQVER